MNQSSVRFLFGKNNSKQELFNDSNEKKISSEEITLTGRVGIQLINEAKLVCKRS